MVILRVNYRYIKDGVLGKNKRREIATMERADGMIFVGGLSEQIKNAHKYDAVQITDVKILWSKKEILEFEGATNGNK